MPDYTTCTIPVGFICIPMDEYVNMKDSAHASMTSLREELARKSTMVVERDATIAKLKESLEAYRKELHDESFRLYEASEKLRCCDEQRHALLDELDKAEKHEAHVQKLLKHSLLEIAATRNRIKDLDPEAFDEWMDRLPELWEIIEKAVPLDDEEDAPDEDDDADEAIIRALMGDDAPEEGTDAAPEEEA